MAANGQDGDAVTLVNAFEPAGPGPTTACRAAARDERQDVGGTCSAPTDAMSTISPPTVIADNRGRDGARLHVTGTAARMHRSG
jgi:hypothetical protein